MTTLGNAPLIEVVLELRWADKEKTADGESSINWGPDDIQFFPGQFRKVAKEHDYVHYEHLDKAPPAPFEVQHRFRKEPNTWPCLQIGVGIFTFNQINTGYDWEPFLESVKEGLNILNEGHPRGLLGLHPLFIELLYIDGLPFKAGQDITGFSRSNLRLGFELPEPLFAFPNLDSAAGAQVRLSYSVSSKIPAGRMIVELTSGKINDKPGLIAHTRVRSMDADTPDFNIDSIAKWLEAAHDIQRHSFKSLIKPVYLETMK